MNRRAAAARYPGPAITGPGKWHDGVRQAAGPQEPGREQPSLKCQIMAQNMQDWLARFAAEIGMIPPTSEELDMLLELAGIAAHASERPAAPITCWLVGRAGLNPRDALAVGQLLAGDSETNGS